MNKWMILVFCTFQFGCSDKAAMLEGDAMEADGTAQVDGGNTDTVEIQIDGEKMWSHLEALQQIADENDGNRAIGTSGFGASVAYVYSTLKSYGYEPAVKEFAVRDFEILAEPELELFGEEAQTFSQIAVMNYSGAGEVSANAQFVDVTIPPGSEENSSTSGCESEDFEDFETGNIAIIQRGSCYFQDKVNNAIAAGAVAVVVFNEGQSGRRGVVEGTLDEGAAANAIPVLGVSYWVGKDLHELSVEGPINLRIRVEAEFVEIPAFNVLVDSASGDENRVVVVGAHLDSVRAGPGINDNGTGVALTLELARQIAERQLKPVNRLRFAFWGAEEVGLLGSIEYVTKMDESEKLSTVIANLNYDMVGSPNPGRFIYDGDGSSSDNSGPPGSAYIESLYEEWFIDHEMGFKSTPFDGRSDYGPFIYYDIAAGGLFTGAEDSKRSSEVEIFGGEANRAYDSCYHEECDTLENVNREVFEEMAGAAAYAMWKMAMTEGDFSGRSRRGSKPTLKNVLPNRVAGCQRHIHLPIQK